MRAIPGTSLLLASLLAAAAPAAEPAPASVRRFALIVGVNDGGKDRVRLRYATSDARAVATVLESLGGVAADDRVLLLDPDRSDVQRALDELGGRLRAAEGTAARVELMVYYSGHSDEEGLLIRGERLDYRALRRAVEALPADVRIAVLDSCASGAFTRRKGGVARPPFTFDASTRVKGHAILTSSSADEAAQESDRVGGSFFTHFLVSGLRGAADASRDGQVTLSEAYQFAFAETLARTERTQGGPQHAAYDIQLAGTGDLVMTDLRATSARLVLAADVGGRVFLRTAAGALAVELTKAEDRPLELGLEPGKYRLTIDAGPGGDGVVSDAVVALDEAARVEISRSQLRTVPREATASRGASVHAPAPARPRPVIGYVRADGMHAVPLNVSMVPGLSLNRASDAGIVNYVSLGLPWARAGRLEGVSLSLLGGTVHGAAEGLQLSLGGNWAGGPLTGLQLALALNGAASVSGAQLSLGVNHAAGGVRVGQATLGVNYAGGDVAGTQLALGFNWAQGAARGAQLALGINHAASVAGVQGALGFSHATHVRGAQLASLNVAGQLAGAQVGLVNFGGRVRGAQIGFVNLADDADATVGFVNIVRHGLFGLTAFATETSYTNLAVKYGGRYFYSTLIASLQPARRTLPLRWGAGFGVGGHVPTRFGWVDLELSAAQHVYGDVRFTQAPMSLLSSLRVLAGLQLARHLALYAGPSLNLLVTEHDRGDIGLGLAPIADLGSPLGPPESVRLFPGLVAGLQL